MKENKEIGIDVVQLLAFVKSRLTAIVPDATAAPDVVYLSSGSLVSRPISET